MEFKVGDKVTRITCDNSRPAWADKVGYTSSMPIGSHWVVTDVAYTRRLVLKSLSTGAYAFDGGPSSNPKYFESYRELFEHGQRIRCVDAGEAKWEGPLKVGEIYEVLDCNQGYVYIKGSPGGWLHSRFELVNDGVDPAVYSRTNDPATSKGKRKVNKYEAAVLECIAQWPDIGCTGKEIAGIKQHPLNCITPRFAPLRRRGLIKARTVLHLGVLAVDKRDKQIVWVLT